MEPIKVAERWEAWAKDCESYAPDRELTDEAIDAGERLRERHLSPVSALAAAGALRGLIGWHDDQHELHWSHCAHPHCKHIADLMALEPKEA